MSTPEFEMRRDPPPDPDVVGEDAELVARLRAEIAERGPITFARFMERALGEPGHGYYRRPEPGPGGGGPGRTGDFLTAPETSPLFGATVARVLEEAWRALGRPDPFVVTEQGAGSGALAHGVLTGVRESDSALAGAIRYRPLDVEPARIAELRRRLDDPALVLDDATGPEAGALLANEVLDALPVHRVVQRATLRERYVAVDGERFVEVEGPPSSAALAAHLEADGITLQAGQVTEVPLAADAWLAGAAGQLGTGLVLVFDYGAEAADVHGPARREGSLRTFARNVVGRDPFVRIGRQDLTTHVCFAGIRRSAAAAGLAPLGESRQAEFLVAAGAGEIARARMDRPGFRLEDAFRDRAALARLIDPRKLGGYRVLGFGRGLPDGWRPAALGPPGPG